MSAITSTRENIYPVSVVIPTLGGESLRGTIAQLNRGTIVPAEIIVCIPEEDAFRVENLSFQNVRVVKTDCRGQVAQRTTGFRLAANPFVLQLDDDILVRETCLERLVESIMLDKHIAVGPKLFDSVTGKYHSFLVPANTKQTLFEKLMYYVINGPKGFQPGQIGISGVNMGVPETDDNLSNLGWLCGGCVLHRKENLILCNYYPFKGKAYGEDLFHSKILADNGVKMMICGAAVCEVDFSSSCYNGFSNFIKGYLSYARVMTKFATVYGGQLPRLYIYLVLNCVGLAFRKLFPAVVYLNEIDYIK